MGTDAMRERPNESRKPRRFGPSQAKVEVAPGQTEAQVLTVMRSILGRPRATLRDAANLAGASDDARVTVAVIPRHGRRIIEIRAESDLIELRALLYQGLDDKPILEDDQIDVREEFQCRGHGARLIGRQVEHAIRLGLVETRAYAVRDDRMGYVGYWVWPLLGFDGPLPGEIRLTLPASLSSARRVRDLLLSEVGQALWHEHGDSVSLVFDLRSNSPDLRHFRGYLRRKGLP
jgi:GNAT superfamily N-acetyltransferase